MAYTEFAPAVELSDLVVCTWERTVAATAAPRGTRVLPDGCVDIVWRGPNLFVAGPDTEPYTTSSTASATIVGVRFRPGAAGAALGLPASELRDMRPSLEDLWGADAARLAERVAGAGEPRLQRRALEQALLARRPAIDDPDPLVAAAVGRLGRSGSRVRSLSRALATSERQLLRRFRAAVGYGPKTLDRILRFQRFVALTEPLAAGRDDLARVAAELGYADQSHLTRDCADLAGLTPARLVASRAA